jgi:Cu2+-containing amine oxidase
MWCCLHVAVAVADTPALRHYSYNYKFYGAVPGAQLVVRMVSEINNYDYIADLWLSVDGVMDVRVVTSGWVRRWGWGWG